MAVMNHNLITTYFAAGCFWGVEAHFKKQKGVVETFVGYMGGESANPSYEQVCSGKTEHCEAVSIAFDPKRTDYQNLLEQFWQCHDPTQIDRQGLDIGRQYRSAIFCTDDNQLTLAQKSKRSLEERGLKIATQIAMAPPFYMAEDYHQNYLDRAMKERGLI